MKIHPVGPHGRRLGLEAGRVELQGLAADKSRPSWLQDRCSQASSREERSHQGRCLMELQDWEMAPQVS